METNASITFLIREEGATLEIVDETSRVRVVKLKLTCEDVCRMFSRHAFLPCFVEYGNLSRVGKKLVLDNIKFEMPVCDYNKRNEIAYSKAVELCPEGWQVDNYFGSKNNWFNKDNKNYCNATIRKWE